MTLLKIPTFSKDLITELDKRYPETTPTVKDLQDIVQVAYNSGRRDLIKNLILLLEMTKEEESHENTKTVLLE